MAFDEYFLVLCNEKKISGVLRLYTWEPEALTTGCFFKTGRLNINRIKKDNLVLIRRITGGNILFHLDNVTYSLILQQKLFELQNYKDMYNFIAGVLVKTFNDLGIKSFINNNKSKYNNPVCLNSVSQYEISDLNGLKIAASSQKVLKNAVLQHGSIYQDSYLKKYYKYLKGFGNFIRYIFYKNKNSNEVSRKITSSKILEKLKVNFSSHFKLCDYTLTEEDLGSINKLINEKYKSDEWNFRK